MRKPLKIGQKEYKFKKDAIAHYKAILNSYDFGQSLNDTDFDDLLDLIDFDYLSELENLEEAISLSVEDESDQMETSDDELLIEDIRIAKVQFSTKCFEIFYNDETSEYISYTMIINNQRYDSEKRFNTACRNSIYNDLRSVKQEYFDQYSVKGQVKCQETGKLSKWTELAVDHRQPNTFSIIVDRFKEVNSLELGEIEYISNEQNHIIFKDNSLIEQFRKYHKEKANLRIVRKECNSSRAGMARIKKNKKDLTIK